MFRGGEHKHIHSDLDDDTNCSKGLDVWHCHNKTELRKMLLDNQGF